MYENMMMPNGMQPNMFPYSGMPMQPSYMSQMNQMNQRPQMVQQPQQQQQNYQMIVPVSNVSDIEHVPVNADGKIFVLSVNDGVLGIRTANKIGLTETEYFRLVEYNPSVEQQKNDYVTRSEFEQFIATLNTNSQNNKPKTAPAKNKEATE